MAVEWSPETMKDYPPGFNPEFVKSGDNEWSLAEKYWDSNTFTDGNFLVPLGIGYFIVRRDDGYYEAFPPQVFESLFVEVVD